MRYRIRYQQSQQHYMTEIEAHNPTEAVVKFEHLKQAPSNQPECKAHVTSVCAAEAGDCWA